MPYKTQQKIFWTAFGLIYAGMLGFLAWHHIVSTWF